MTQYCFSLRPRITYVFCTSVVSIYRSLNNLAGQCGGQQQHMFQQYYGNPYMQNLQQSGVNYGAYNTHYNQNYGQSSWKK